MDNAELRIRIIEGEEGTAGAQVAPESAPQTPRAPGRAAEGLGAQPEWIRDPWRDWRTEPPPRRAASDTAAEAAEARKAKKKGGGKGKTAAASEAAEEAGGAMEILGPLAAVAGAFILADLAARAVASGIAKMGDAIQAEGNIVATLVSGDNMGALVKQANAAAEALGNIPIVGHVLEESIKTFAKALDAVAEVAGSIIQRGQQLAPYSGELAMAGARAEIKSMMADIREAQVLGPGMAQVTDIWTDIQMELREFLLPLKKFLIEEFAQFLEWLKNFFEENRGELIAMRETLIGLLKAFIDFLLLKWPTAAKDVAEIPKRIKQALEESAQAQRMVDNPIFQQFMEFAGNAHLPQCGVPEASPFASQLAIPALAG